MAWVSFRFNQENHGIKRKAHKGKSSLVDELLELDEAT